MGIRGTAVGGWEHPGEVCRALCTNGTGGGFRPPPPCRGRGVQVGICPFQQWRYCRTRLPPRLGPLFQITLPGSGELQRPPGERPECQAGESPCFFFAAFILIYISLGLNRVGSAFLSKQRVCGSAGMMQARRILTPAPCPPGARRRDGGLFARVRDPLLSRTC